MAQLDFVLTQFHSDLQRARELLELVKTFRVFASSKVPVEITRGELDWPEAIKLAASAPTVRTDLPVLSGSILLYICGRFEYFVREVIVALADEMIAKASTYEDIPEKVRGELISKTLDVAQNPARYGYSKAEAEQLLVTFARNIDAESSAGPLAISSRVLAITESNMNSRTVAEVFKRLNIVDLWTDIGKQAVLKVHLSTSDDGACKRDATSKLDALMKERNAIAHPTGSVTFPGADQVIEVAQFLQVLSRVIVDVARVPRG